MHYGPGIDSASKRNDYQQYFLGGKCGWGLGLTALPPSRFDCLQIWKPVQELLYDYGLEIYFVSESRDCNICVQTTVFLHHALKAS
jgi:hypothetical protein